MQQEVRRLEELVENGRQVWSVKVLEPEILSEECLPAAQVTLGGIS